jgi:MFS transporter, DHA1 family, inner membrane transport protein
MQSRPAPAINERLALLVLAAVQFTHIMDFMIMMPLGSQLMRVFAITPAQFSQLVASYGISAAITGFLGGFVVDRFDRRHALLTLYAGFSLATLACALAPNYAALLLARVLAGGFGGVAGSVVVAMVGDIVPPERRGRGMSSVMSAFPLASILGVPAGLWLAGLFGWHAPFFLLVGLSGVVFAIACKTIPSIRSAHAPAHPWTQMSAILAHPVHQRGLLMSAFLVFAGGCMIPFMAPAMVANVGLTEAQLPWIYFAGGVATFFTTPIVGRLADKYDKLHVLAWMSAGSIVAALVVSNLPAAPLYVAMLATALFMVSMSGRFSPSMAMLSKAVDERYRGGFMSVNSAVQQAASGLANLVAGLIVVTGPGGRLLHYPWVGILSATCMTITVFLAARVRAAAPHAARPYAQSAAAPG